MLEYVSSKERGRSSYIFYITAFPAEFVRKDKGRWCNKRKNNVLREFWPKSKDQEDAITSRLECEEFCSNIEQCWGCSVDCGPSCRWNAISESFVQNAVAHFQDRRIGKIEPKCGCWLLLAVGPGCCGLVGGLLITAVEAKGGPLHCQTNHQFNKET